MQQKPQWHIDIEKGPYEGPLACSSCQMVTPTFFSTFSWVYDSMMLWCIYHWKSGWKFFPPALNCFSPKKLHSFNKKAHTHTHTPNRPKKSADERSFGKILERIIWVTQLPPIFAVFSLGCHKMPGAWRSSAPSGCDASGGFLAVEDDRENLRCRTPCLPDLLGRSRPGCNRFCCCDGINGISAFFVLVPSLGFLKTFANPPKPNNIEWETRC